MAVLKLEVGYLSENFELEDGDSRFRKEVIRAGTYYHPDAPQGTLDVTTERMQMWADNFAEAGVKVWVPYRHSKDPKENTGWVEDITVEGDRLFATLNITDAAAAEMLRDGTIQDVSIGIEFDFVDDRGRRFAEVIRHIALTVDPHIREQGPFDEVQTKLPRGDNPSEIPTAPTDDTVTTESGRDRGELTLEQRNDELTAENRQLHDEMARLRTSAEDNVKRDDERLVERYIADGLLTPACRKEARALLSARADFVEMEEGISSIHNTFRTLVEKLPTRIGYGQALKLEPPPEPGSDDEERMLAKLGLTREDISQYSTK
ncbi:MAG: hypothetical protein GY771_14135 [bacterium]|nr:hypothetical protein [bacterium]